MGGDGCGNCLVRGSGQHVSTSGVVIMNMKKNFKLQQLMTENFNNMGVNNEEI